MSLTIGIIREGKIPPDTRVPLTPAQCHHIQQAYGIGIRVQSAPSRCYTDQEYRDAGIAVVEDVSDCGILMGVKEVPVDQLIPGKTYFFFSHTIKKQAHNRALLRAILDRRIRLIDYETLTDERGERLIAFGRFAGMVGAHNALYTYGARTSSFHLPRMKDCRDYEEAKAIYSTLDLPPVRIVLTGTGRVAGGCVAVLEDMGIERLSPAAFLEEAGNDRPVYTQLGSREYTRRRDGLPFDKAHFYANPGEYVSNFAPYAAVADIFINGIYWDTRAPAFFSAEEMATPSFNPRVIADVTCDIAPESSVPSTLRASTIQDPVYGYDPRTQKEIAAYSPDGIDIMAIDNLPNELPRDASQAFGTQFIEHVLTELTGEGDSSVLSRATIAEGGRLTAKFSYLSDFVGETAPS